MTAAFQPWPGVWGVNASSPGGDARRTRRRGQSWHPPASHEKRIVPEAEAGRAQQFGHAMGEAGPHRQPYGWPPQEVLPRPPLVVVELARIPNTAPREVEQPQARLCAENAGSANHVGLKAHSRILSAITVPPRPAAGWLLDGNAEAGAPEMLRERIHSPARWTPQEDRQPEASSSPAWGDPETHHNQPAAGAQHAPAFPQCFRPQDVRRGKRGHYGVEYASGKGQHLRSPAHGPHSQAAGRQLACGDPVHSGRKLQPHDRPPRSAEGTQQIPRAKTELEHTSLHVSQGHTSPGRPPAGAHQPTHTVIAPRQLVIEPLANPCIQIADPVH